MKRAALNDSLDLPALTRAFACRWPARMHWENFAGGISCRGCGGACGTSDTARFARPRPQQMTLELEATTP